MSSHTFIAISAFVSAVLAVYSGIPYIRSVLSGRTKPHRFSWFILTLIQAIVVISQFLKGGRASIIVTFIFLLYCSVIFVLSLTPKGTKDTSRYDRLLFFLALITILAWILTKNPAVAIWLSVIPDMCATLMIILKIKASPLSEDPFPWTIGTIAYVFGCLTLVATKPGILYV